MAIKIYKKNNAGRRNMSVVKPEGITDKAPEKSLLAAYKSVVVVLMARFRLVTKVVVTSVAIVSLISVRTN
jgi:hypothetical protein